MVYSPGVKVYVETENNGTLDLSNDLTEGTMVRRSDGVSTFSFGLQNTRRKYDGLFTPNDRIVVLMKRLTWLQVYSGYLNSVPMMSAWPKVIQVSSSCTLKRLQYWYWDPYTTAAWNLIQTSLEGTSDESSFNTDGGLTNVIKNVLDKVVGWPDSKIHIGRIPADWFKIAEQVATEIGKESKDSLEPVLEQLASMAGTSYSGASTAVYTGDLKPGTYGGESFDRTQLAIAVQIWNVGSSIKGITETDMITAFSVAIAESHLTNSDVAVDHDSVGVFQQRPSQGWGSVQQCANVEYAATTFFTRLKALTNRDKMTTWMAGQTIQNSAFEDGSNYQATTPQAKALVAAMTAKLKKTTGVTQTQGVATGDALVSWALQLVDEYPNIEYSQARDFPLSQYPPPHLDCSNLVRYVYYHTLGGTEIKPGVSDVSDIDAQCERITLEEAMVTPGAVLIRQAEHIGLSIGNNSEEVATNTRDLPARVKVADTSFYQYGGLLPRITYNRVGSTTTSGAKTDNQGYAVDTQGATYTGQTDPGTLAPGGTKDDFNTLFGDSGFVAAVQDTQANTFAQTLQGIRALLNDQPLLGGFLKNILNASLRSFCSAPNGDFIAWFPDYYGLWGTAAVMVVEPIEVLDFTVDWSDDFFVTHQFTVLGIQNTLDVATGAASVNFGSSEGTNVTPNDLAYSTFGLANIDIPSVMELLFGIKATKQEAQEFTDFIYRKFGARPDYQVIDGMIADNDHRAEFFSALYLFMRQWAYQYNAQVPLTFMPELFPGMLLQIPKFDFQGYVTTVTHSFNFGPQGGFNTSVNLAAPARLPRGKEGQGVGANQHTLMGLPLAGGYTPGMTREQAQKVLRPAIETTPEPPTNAGAQ
jgi:hypothetical protein